MGHTDGDKKLKHPNEKGNTRTVNGGYKFSAGVPITDDRYSWIFKHTLTTENKKDCSRTDKENACYGGCAPVDSPRCPTNRAVMEPKIWTEEGCAEPQRNHLCAPVQNS